MKELNAFRDPKEYGPVLDEMFMEYVRSEAFTNLNEAGRNEFINKVQELKQIVTSED